MARVTLEVPEYLLGDIYIAVGKVLQNAQDNCDEEPGQAGPRARDDGDELADQA